MRHLVAIAALAVPLPAFAQPEGADTPAQAEPATESSAGIPAASDMIGGRLRLAASGLVAVPFGELDAELDLSDVAEVGFGGQLQIGYGIGRHVELGLFGEYTAFSDGDRCARCGASSFAGGPFLRYHLVQGTRFDPWASVAVALRHLSTDEFGDTSGLDWLRLELGADWYALSQIGFGPYAGLTLGTFTDPPTGRGASVYGIFTAGLRLLFDPVGR